MASDIAKSSRLDMLRLDSENYLFSLIDQAVELGLISERDTDGIRYDCLKILAKLSEKYCGGKSSSIQTDVAENILSSVVYTLGVALKEFVNPDDALAALLKNGAEPLFLKGRKQLDKMVFSARMIHSQLISRVFETRNTFYSATLVDGIEGFFKLYSPDFSAHEIHITADYPTCVPIGALHGIEFIKRYLEYLSCENEFLCCFDSADVHYLLCGYDEKYPELIFNIFEIVLRNAIGAILVQKSDIRSLELTTSDVEFLVKLLNSSGKTEMTKIISQAADEVVSILAPSVRTAEYLRLAINTVAAGIGRDIESVNPEKAFTVPEYPENRQIFSFSFGNRMPDKNYRAIVNSIIGETTSECKIAIICNSIHSLIDLEDVISDAELSVGEISRLLLNLSPVELAAFVKKYVLPDEWEHEDISLRQPELCEAVKKHISEITSEQREWIMKAAEKITLDA